jgi:hypothetical protein
MTRGRLIFTCVWLAVFAVAFLLWAFVLGEVSNLLTEYEGVQPEYEAQAIFDSYFAEADAATIAGYDKYNNSSYDTEGAAGVYLASLLKGKSINYVPVLSSDSSVKAYAVVVDGVQFASFTLVKGDEKTEKLGISKWTLGTIDVKIEPVCGVSVFAPKSAIVKVNGIPLTEEYREGDYIELGEAVYFPAGDADARMMANYYIDDLFVDPVVTVESADGSVSYGLEYDKEKSAYNAEYSYRVLLADKYNQQLLEEEKRKQEEEERLKREEEERLKREEEERQRISDEIKAEYGDFIYEALTLYARYTHITNEENNKIAWDVLAYFKSGTALYKFIKDYYNYSAYIPDGYEYSNVDMHHFAWSDEAKTSFECVFEMDLIMTVNGSGNQAAEKVTEPFCFKVYVDISGKKPLITALENYSEA